MNTKRKLCFIINLILSLAIMTVIFLFSTESGDTSADRSSSLKETLLSFLDPVLPDLIYNFIDEHIRQLAHFTLYFLLGITVSMATKCVIIHPIFPYITSFVICFVYALSDELHQYFVPGRSCRIIDIGIDSLGAILSISLHLFIVLIIKHKEIKST